MPSIEDKVVDALLSDLPDSAGAGLFYTRLAAEHVAAARSLVRDEGLLSDALALAAWSPLLGTTLIQNPAYLSWLGRERTHARVRSREELLESLARFAHTNTQLDPQTLLARFRRRELLRIYLKDIRNTATIVETTEELSNVADAILQYALRLASQELDNLYGAPLRTDERGRTGAAEFCIVALGKLGSLELNYASDIDLFFIYSADGATTGAGERGSLTNREYFIKLAGSVARITGQAGGQSAPYRVDLRLRPHGRDGVLAVSLTEAVRYYRETAHDWELQILIRARAAAGSHALYTRFAEAVSDRVFRLDETVNRALGHVRLAKYKIDRHHNQKGNCYNVKLGRGGIREIEFIAQALQLAYGGRDVWLRAPHTLISLGRLRDRQIIAEREHGRLAAAYVFLRKLEHRLQMEHGLQTHTLPCEAERRALIARRMHYDGALALANFERELKIQTEHVHAVFTRVFGRDEETLRAGDATSSVTSPAPAAAAPPARARTPADQDEVAQATRRTEPSPENHPTSQHTHTLLLKIAAIYTAALTGEKGNVGAAQIAGRLRDAAALSLNPARALLGIETIAYSLAKFSAPVHVSANQLDALVRLCGVSEPFTEMIAGNPALIEALPTATRKQGEDDADDDQHALTAAVAGEGNFGAELAALRRAWAKLLVETGARDASGEINMREANARQTALAVASINTGYDVARRELMRRLRSTDAALLPALAVLGLGRLSGNGLDYGSDLDLVLIYDDENMRLPNDLAAAELMARLTELFVSALSSMTREGQLYRVDLRLRPDGKNGPLALPARAFTEYIEKRAAPWEWLAYVKLRATGGALSFGRDIELQARALIHKAARDAPGDMLRAETIRVRERLEKERARGRRQAVDIKYGPGGMLDVYFAIRYLQLKTDVRDEEGARSTLQTLEKLTRAAALAEKDFTILREGYEILRTVDHYTRLIVGRSTRLQGFDHPALRDIAQRVGYASPDALLESLTAHMREIRGAYERILEA